MGCVRARAWPERASSTFDEEAGRTKRVWLVSLPVLFALAALACNGGEAVSTAAPSTTSPLPATPREYAYSVVARYPHDPDAFTEGLVYDGGVLYEGTGLVGKSALRKVDLKTGNVEQNVPLPSPFFGEGIAIFGERIFQLTWQSRAGLIYDKSSFKPLGRFAYDTEGWGLTEDGMNLIMSDGTRTLYYLSPDNLNVVGRIEVTGGPDAVGVMKLNELEYVKGEIYANVWPTDFIVRIDPKSGAVTGWVNLGGILGKEQSAKVDVLNGIAYDAQTDRLFVTGKLWPSLFEIKLVPKD
jgi:glutamine cyclotransferase